LAIADKPRNIADRDRGLLDEQLRGGCHAARKQILVEADLAELGVRSLHLARRARYGAGHVRQCQPATVVAGDDDARQQVEASSARERLRMHAPLLRPLTARPDTQFRRI
jgi:hypothetical protein